jgi:hypothetical protein
MSLGLAVASGDYLCEDVSDVIRSSLLCLLEVTVLDSLADPSLQH